jgi:hypothetical protein
MRAEPETVAAEYISMVENLKTAWDMLEKSQNAREKMLEKILKIK